MALLDEMPATIRDRIRAGGRLGDDGWEWCLDVLGQADLTPGEVDLCLDALRATFDGGHAGEVLNAARAAEQA